MSVNQNVKVNQFAGVLNAAVTNSFVRVLFFSILTAFAAQVTIPVQPVPFTLQTMMVVLSGAFLGAKKGAYSQMLYLAMGVIGLPVFTQMPDGLYGFAKLFGPTGGYLLAFPFAAFISGYILEKNKSYLSSIISMTVGNVFIILSGAIYLDAVYIHNMSESLKAGAVIFSIWTVIKILAAASIYSGISRKK